MQIEEEMGTKHPFAIRPILSDQPSGHRDAGLNFTLAYCQADSHKSMVDVAGLATTIAIIVLFFERHAG